MQLVMTVLPVNCLQVKKSDMGIKLRQYIKKLLLINDQCESSTK